MLRRKCDINKEKEIEVNKYEAGVQPILNVPSTEEPGRQADINNDHHGSTSGNSQEHQHHHQTNVQSKSHMRELSTTVQDKPTCDHHSAHNVQSNTRQDIQEDVTAPVGRESVINFSAHQHSLQSSVDTSHQNVDSFEHQEESSVAGYHTSFLLLLAFTAQAFTDGLAFHRPTSIFRIVVYLCVMLAIRSLQAFFLGYYAEVDSLSRMTHSLHTLLYSLSFPLGSFLSYLFSLIIGYIFRGRLYS